MPLWNDACMKRMMFIGFSLKNELPMARLYSFHAFPLKFQMGERLMSPRNVGVVFCVFSTCEISSLLVDCCCRCPFFSSCFLVLSRWFSLCPSYVVCASLLLAFCFGGRLCVPIKSRALQNSLLTDLTQSFNIRLACGNCFIVSLAILVRVFRSKSLICIVIFINMYGITFSTPSL